MNFFSNHLEFVIRELSVPPFLSGQRITGYPSLLPRDIGDRRPRSYNGIKIPTTGESGSGSRHGGGKNPLRGRVISSWRDVIPQNLEKRETTSWKSYLALVVLGLQIGDLPLPLPLSLSLLNFVERRICPKLVRPWLLGARENTIAATKITSRNELLLK